jgi:hypothetical protein
VPKVFLTGLFRWCALLIDQTTAVQVDEKVFAQGGASPQQMDIFTVEGEIVSISSVN